MKNKIKLVILLIVASLGLGLSTITTAQTHKTAPPAAKTEVAKPAQAPVYINANSLEIVANPAKYLNKHVKIQAKFDKFSALGLDYKPAFRSSEKYITFLIKRDDVTNHTIPLSEMKIFIKRDEAEKYIDLNPGDEISFTGYVFSNALSDVWIDVEEFTVLNPKPKDQNSTKK